jgi:type I restriction enzyme S subunit
MISAQIVTRAPLPQGWCEATLEQISEIIFGQSPPSSTYNETREGLPFYQGKLDFGEMCPIPRKWCSSPQKIAEKGDVLISIRAPVGPTNLCPEKSCIGRGLAAIRPLGGISSSFVLYLLRANEMRIAGKGTGTTFSAITSPLLRKCSFSLPPLSEQKRIVSKIEELFTKLDAGIEYLKKARMELKRYRRSVLDAAFRGKLSEHWRREQNADAQYPEQTDLSYDHAALIEIDYLNSIAPIRFATSWKFVNLGQLTSRINPGFPSGKHNQSGLGVPHIRPMNINGKGQIDLTLVKYVQTESYDNLKKGDVLFNNTNSPELLGKTTYIKEDTNWAYSNHMTRIRLDTSSVNPAWIAYALHDLFLNGFFKKSCVHHVNQASINSTFLTKNTFVPLPSLNEQNVIVEEIERLLSIVDEIEPSLSSTELLGQRLRQSVLGQAFLGKLVPQDPTDEPAQMLLEEMAKQKKNVEPISIFPNQRGR